MQLAEKFGARAAITVNDNNYPISSINPWTTNPTAKEAAAWVAYVNGDPNNITVIGVDENGTNWGTVRYWAQKRVANGHPNPYNVKYWEIGNEDYSFSSDTGTQYASRFLSYSQEMKRVDPTIWLGAVMYNDQPQNNWNKIIIQNAQSAMNYLIYHDYLVEDVTMNTLYGPTTITVPFTLSASTSSPNAYYVFTIKALTVYNSPAVSHVKILVDGNVQYDGALARQHDNFNLISFTVPASQLSSSANHILSINAYDVQKAVQIYRTFTINNQPYDIYTQQQLYEKRMATTPNITQHVLLLRQLAQSLGLASNFPIYVSEYDTLDSYATPFVSFTSSLMTASMLASYIQNNVNIASFWLLNDFKWWSATAPQGNAGNPHYANPQFYAMELLRHHTSHTLIATNVTSPTFGNNIPTLQAYATVDTTVSPELMHLVVINKSYNQDITTQIKFNNTVPYANAKITTLNASNVASVVTSSTDHDIALHASQLPNYPFTYTFPAHSVTTIDVDIQIPPAPTPTATPKPLPTFTPTSKPISTPRPTSTPTPTPFISIHLPVDISPTSVPTPTSTPAPTAHLTTIFGPTNTSIVKNDSVITAGDNSVQDVQISYSFTLHWTQTTHDQHTGVYVRMNGQDWAQVFFRQAGIYLTTHSSAGYGHEQQLLSTSIADGSTHSVIIVVKESTIQVTFDGNQLSTTVSSMLTSGSVELYSYWINEVDFTNLLVQKISYY